MRGAEATVMRRDRWEVLRKEGRASVCGYPLVAEARSAADSMRCVDGMVIWAMKWIASARNLRQSRQKSQRGIAEMGCWSRNIRHHLGSFARLGVSRAGAVRLER